MRCRWVTLIVGVFALTLSALSQQTAARLPRVQDCKHVTLSGAGIGVAYRGDFRNEDYNLSARIPDGVTAWGGVDESAPFHGFTMFLNSEERSCIFFEIHIRVDDSDAIARPPGATPVPLGKAKGWHKTRVGLVDGVRVSNVTTLFSFKRPGEIDDGTILLVVPTAQMRKALPIYTLFVQSVNFGH